MAKKAKKTNKKPAKSAAKKSVKKPAPKAAKKPAAKKPVAKQAAAKKKTAPAKKAKPAKSVKKAAAPKGDALMGIAPGFTANDAAVTVAWYCDVLGFTIKERWEHDGVFHGGQVVSGGVTVNIGQDDWKKGRDRIKGQGTRMYVTMGPDIDQYATAIKARGGILDKEPADGYGTRFFEISDPNGFQLTFIAAAKK